METSPQKSKRVYEEGRFEFIIYLNDDIICKRNLVIHNFIEHSMETLDFKICIDNIVRMIDDDLKSKSRVYTWNYFNPNETPAEEFTAPLLDPWTCVFKIVITDNKRVVHERIWDGYAYPRFVRDKVDLTNKNVRVYNKETGEIEIIPKEEFFASRGSNLPFYFQTLRDMIMDKGDVIAQIARQICDVCTAREGSYENLSDYTISENYKSKGQKAIKYNYNMDAVNQKYITGWAKAVAEKTKAYMETLY